GGGAARPHAVMPSRASPSSSASGLRWTLAGPRSPGSGGCPRDQWAVMIPGHHRGYISLQTHDANIARLAANSPAPAGGAAREGAAGSKVPELTALVIASVSVTLNRDSFCGR